MRNCSKTEKREKTMQNGKKHTKQGIKCKVMGKKKETETSLKKQVDNVKLHATAYRQNPQICYMAHVRTSPLLLKQNCDTTPVTMGATEHLKMRWLKRKTRSRLNTTPSTPPEDGTLWALPNGERSSFAVKLHSANHAFDFRPVSAVAQNPSNTDMSVSKL